MLVEELVEELVERLTMELVKAGAPGRPRMVGIWFVDRPDEYRALADSAPQKPEVNWLGWGKWMGIALWLYGPEQMEDAREFLRGLGRPEWLVMKTWPISGAGVWVEFSDGTTLRVAE